MSRLQVKPLDRFGSTKPQMMAIGILQYLEGYIQVNPGPHHKVGLFLSIFVRSPISQKVESGGKLGKGKKRDRQNQTTTRTNWESRRFVLKMALVTKIKKKIKSSSLKSTVAQTFSLKSKNRRISLSFLAHTTKKRLLRLKALHEHCLWLKTIQNSSTVVPQLLFKFSHFSKLDPCNQCRTKFGFLVRVYLIQGNLGLCQHNHKN